MSHAKFHGPWVRGGLITLGLVSLTLIYRAWENAGPWVSWVHNDEGDAQVLLQASYPVFLALASPLIFFLWRARTRIAARYDGRSIGATLFLLSLTLLFLFDGFRVRENRERREKATLDSALLYWSQGLADTSVRTLTEALALDPGQTHLAVRLAWTLAKLNRAGDAKRWLDIVDKMEVPPYLTPAVQETRLALEGQ